MSPDPTHLDVIVIGAGISGICAAYYLQEHGHSFAVLEARDTIGGTWDLFRYPGIRSDSDMFTLGFSFHPWTDGESIADAPAIRRYLRETVDTYDLERHFRYGARVVACRWSSDARRWTVEVRDREGGYQTFTCRFLWGCTGYYRYAEGYTPELPGRENFRGTVIHPQQWPEDLDYRGQRVVVIGSGATAVTLVPAMASEAAHVTMLQRTPTYILSWPRVDPIAQRLRELLPDHLAHGATRWKNVMLGTLIYQLSQRFPDRARAFFIERIEEELGDGFDVEKHFSPSYDPWDQRLCLVPEGDLFAAMKEGKASVVTDRIDRITETGIALASGEHLDADIIVTATGLQVELLGGAALEVDGRPLKPAETMMYKGAMLSGVPNFAMSLGYTNASWTLKCELIAKYVVRLLAHMDRHGYEECRPEPDASVQPEPLIDLASGYIRRAQHLIPKQGSRSPWRLHQNYVLDRLLLGRGRVDDASMRFL